MNKGTKRQFLARLFLKNGRNNISQRQTNRLNFFTFPNLVSQSWSTTLSIFSIILLTSWLFFAILYWIICYTHGDFEANHLPARQAFSNFTPCIYRINNFASCFLFSIERQHIIGYGIKATTDECPEAIFVNAFQCIIGFIMQGFMAVTIFAKMTLPRKRSKTLLFSKHATISLRNSQLCLMFRIGDMRKNHIIEARVRAFYLSNKKTLEGEKLQHHQTELLLHSDGCKERLFFNWPLVVFHIIDKNSPLYEFGPGKKHEVFEIVVVLEGTIASTGQMTQAKTSYIPQEILWGKSFESLLSFNTYRQEFEVDFSKFDNLISTNTPPYSAATLNQLF